MFRFALPLGIFALIVVFLGIGLKLDPREVPSPFIDKPAPGIDLPELFDPTRRITNQTFAGQVWVLNVWASWCVACRSEHPLFNDFVRRSDVPLVGLNYKDAGPDAKNWLRELGDPYDYIAVDLAGDTGIEWGVYGVPETFVIDREGIVRYKHIGPLEPSDMYDKLLPLVESLQGNS